jgi:hypothetical protein
MFYKLIAFPEGSCYASFANSFSRDIISSYPSLSSSSDSSISSNPSEFY